MGVSKSVNDNQTAGSTESVRLDAGHHEIFPSGQALAGWLGVGLAGFICLFLALAFVHIFSPGLQVKDIADRDLIAPEDISVIDRIETDKAIALAKQSIIPVFQVDRGRDQASQAAVQAALKKIEQYQAMGLVPVKVPVKTTVKNTAGPGAINISPAQIARILLSSDESFAQQLTAMPAVASELNKRRQIILNARKSGAFTLKDNELLTALIVEPAALSEYKKTMVSSGARLCSKFNRFPVSDKHVWEEIAAEFLPDSMPFNLKLASSSLLAENLEPNMVIDNKATQNKTEEVVKTVAPIMLKIAKGQTIVPRGALISESKLELLQALGITHINRWPFIFSMAVSLIAALTLVALFLYTYEPKHFFSSSSIGLMFTVAIVACTVASIIGKTYPQFVPIPAAALILTIFFGHRVAIVWTIPMIMLVAVDHLIDLRNIFAHCLASAAAIWTYSKRRNALISTSLCVAGGQVIGDLAACAATQSITSWTMLGRQAGIDFFGGMFSAILAIGSLPFLENIFGLITPFRLTELTDANQPLLRRLEETAPGTYQHSLAVANLAEAGAKAISADPNMVRAGALYHDIGKMVRPKYFIENQLGDTNPHDSMTPEESRGRVLAHVTDGIELGQKYALPKAIQDFIPMHQGTTLMAYFYHKACLRDGADKVDSNFYRYPGPKPNTKETAVVMLADVSEAVTHSMQNPTNEEVEIALERVFQNRWDDGQFTDSSLTLEELHKVKAGFCRVWRTLHHERLKYPSTTTGKMPIAPVEVSAAAPVAGTATGTVTGTATEPAEVVINTDCCS